MTTADTGGLTQDVPGVHAAVAALDGQMLLAFGPPLAGKDRFAERVLRRASAANRDTLHIAATRGHDRLASGLPDRTVVVDCSPGPTATGDRVADVATPADLTGIGIHVSRFVESVTPRPVVTLDSISTLLAYNEAAVVFRFLAVLAGQLQQVDGVGVFLMDQGSHSRQTVATFQQLFDGRVDVESDRARLRGVDGLSPGWSPR